jgi:hypothetical protein
MTINCQIDTITNSIAGLSVTGVTIKDIHDIPESAALLLPVMFPRPNEFITDLTFTRVSQGGGGTALMDVSYTLNYVYCHAPIGSGVGGLFSSYNSLITNIALILEKLFASDNITGAVDMTVAGISSVGPVADPAGNPYHGVEISLRILEFAQ